MRNNRYTRPHDQQVVSLRRLDWDEENVKRIFCPEQEWESAP